MCLCKNGKKTNIKFGYTEIKKQKRTNIKKLFQEKI